MFSKLLCSLTILSATLSGVRAQEPIVFNVANKPLDPDGFNRSTVVVNGQFPGPLITANKGDTVFVRVVNQLEDPKMRLPTSVHWHGLVTQCPISAGHEYTYKIDVGSQSGTYWYHSHFTSQYIDGLRGPIVINPQDPNIGKYQVDDDSHIIVLGDWFHDPSSDLLDRFSLASNGGIDILPKSGTINGVGRTSTGPQKDHPVFKVTNGTSYRFRIINISALAFFDFQIQGHKFTVIEADGEPHSQVQEPVDWLRIIPGMRYSIVVNADQGGGNYWIHAPMGGGRVTNPPPADWERDRVNVNAILRYDGAEEVPPTGDPPHPPTGTQFREDLLIPLVDPTPPGQPFIGGADRVFNLTFTGSVDPVDGTWGFDINGIRYKPDRQNNRTVPTLLRILSEGARNETDFPLSEHTRTIQRGEVVEISITGAPGHPFHLHGHTFYVVKGPTGTANFTSAPKRDVIASGGFNNPTVIRFVADNPGPWILHCHIELHLDTGLAMVFAEDPAGIADGPDKVEPSDEWKQLCTIYDSLNPSEQ